jgi:hypothetical protein
MIREFNGTEAGWRTVADELASALRATILRNPTVTARDWDQAQAALGRYERAGSEHAGSEPAAGLSEPAGD